METNPFLKAALQPRQRRLEIGGDPKLGGKHIQLAKNATRFHEVHESASSYPAGNQGFMQGRTKVWKTFDFGILTAV